ncbi:MAG: tetratricopeptide repeat protein [Alphaproteobacteria bacterium]|nr:tetratricopeptide repeat protein [Alphaproteobacteria bacterium]
MSKIDQWLNEASAALGTEPPDVLVRRYESALRGQPGSVPLRLHLGIARLAAERVGEALEVLERTLAGDDSEPVGWIALGAARRRSGDSRGSATALWNALRLLPDDPGVREVVDEACESLRSQARALALEGRFDEAEDLLDHALLLDPDDWGALHDQGVVALRRKDPFRAEELFRRSLARRIAPVALCNHGSALADLGRHAEALALYRRCVELFPDHGPAYYNTACSLGELGRPDEALAMYREAIRRNPNNAEAYNNLGNIEADLGRTADAVAHFRRAVELRPDYERANSNLVYNLYYLSDVTGEEIALESRLWGERHGRPPAAPAVHHNTPDPERRLRVGYLSPDFRDHAASYFMEPVLAHHDRDRFEVVCYAVGKQRDHVTERMKGYGPVWREVESLSDPALAALIRDDGIDILVDCAGHSHGNRLGMFALQPAPIQCGNHLGVPGTLGVPAIRHFLTDPFIAPEGTDAFFTERVIRLPRAFLPFRVRPEWPEVPPRQPGPPVLACFAEPLRFSPVLIAAWRRILDSVPESRLLLKHPRYANRQVTAHYRRLLASLGDRVDFEDIEGGWDRHWGVYGRVSVMLDSFPVTGATSTVIPLWMGVPVISTAGVHPGQRFGVSMLSNAGVPELIATDMDDYAARAAALLRDRDRLDRYRARLRGTLAASPLLDGPGRVAELESAYRRLWEDHCRAPA